MLEPVPLPKSRLEAITDGIFSVTMTLLVLDLRLPGNMADSAQLSQAIFAEIPAFDNYVISFVMLCVFWISHLRLLRRLDSIDATFTWLNLAFLLFTTFVPVLTAFAGRNPGHPRPAVLYGVNLIAILACEMLMWRHALPRLVNGSVTDPAGAWRTVRRKFAIAMGVVVLGLALAMLEIRVGMSSGLASYTYLLLILVGIMHPAVRQRRHRAATKPRVSASRE
jgi:uncharacterized membrane protein